MRCLRSQPPRASCFRHSFARLDSSPAFLSCCDDSLCAGKAIDLTREEFPEEKFDVALDKACLDSIACSPQGVPKVELYLQQMDRFVSNKTTSP